MSVGCRILMAVVVLSESHLCVVWGLFVCLFVCFYCVFLFVFSTESRYIFLLIYVRLLTSGQKQKSESC